MDVARATRGGIGGARCVEGSGQGSIDGALAHRLDLRGGGVLGLCALWTLGACGAGQTAGRSRQAPPAAPVTARVAACVPPMELRYSQGLVLEPHGDPGPRPLLQAAMPGKVVWSSRGNALAIFGEVIQFWDARRWELVGEAPGGSPEPIDGTDRFAVRDEGGIAVWDGREGSRLFGLEGTEGAGPLRFTRDGRFAHSGTVVWELGAGRTVMRGVEGDGLETCALRQDGRQLVQASLRHAHAPGGGTIEAGRLVLMDVPSGRVLSEARIPPAEAVFWPRPDTVVVLSGEGLWLGSPRGGFRRLASGVGTLQFSSDLERVAFVPFEAPGIKIIGLARRGVIAERRRGFVHAISPTLEHWLWKSDPQVIDETHLVLEAVGGGSSLPLQDVQGWSGDGRSVLLRRGGSLQTLDVRAALRGAASAPVAAAGPQRALDWQPRPDGGDGVLGGDAWGSAGPVLRWSPAGAAPLASAARLAVGAARFSTHAPGWILGGCWTDRTWFDGRAPFTCRSSYLGWFDGATGRPLHTSTRAQPTLLWPEQDPALAVGHGDPSWGCLVGRHAPPVQQPGFAPVLDCPVERWSLEAGQVRVAPVAPACAVMAPDASLGATYQAGDAVWVLCPEQKTTIETGSTRLVFARRLGGPPTGELTLPTPWLSAAGSLGSDAWYACGAPLPAECDHTGQSDCWVWTLPIDGAPRVFRPEGPVRRVGTGGELVFWQDQRLRVLDARTGEASVAWPQQGDPDASSGANVLPGPRGGFIAIDQGAIRLWKRCGGVGTVDPSLRQPAHPLRDWAFSEDERLLAWIDDGGLTVISTESRRAVRRVPGLVCGEWLSGGVPRRLSFREDGRVLFVACDHAAALVRVDRPQRLELQALRRGDAIGWLAIAPDGAIEGTDGVLALVKRRVDGAMVPAAPGEPGLVARLLE